ncbi:MULTISPECIES: hypothetical protein [Halocynthiibacter]|uniref:Uncharacterized protein n=1 Tax=Halocynthiibacter halioticoli TaxID=2986804 RepID=A0AAE3J2B3_9RHOB|nr:MULTISPECIES: hypothetical protein [Halocynthiibacter]MCV6825396.1 hypothetical protein [Halocynthiibacter halioticoli]MCW4058397.1 hypothetical protein [Halocynthiibacter sp. SDUM655004]
MGSRHSVILISKLDQLLAQQLEIAQAIDAAGDNLDCTMCLAQLERLEQMFTSLLPDYDPRTAVACEDSPL